MLDAAEARQATAEVMASHSIPAIVSRDLLDVLPDGAVAEVAEASRALAAATSAMAGEAPKAASKKGGHKPEEGEAVAVEVEAVEVAAKAAP